MTKGETRVVWADAVRVLAVFLVVVIHLAAGVVTAWQRVPTYDWWAAHWYDSLSRVSVVLFVLLSGGLLLGKTEPTTAYFSKRLSRIVLPWLWWVALTILIDWIFQLNTDGFSQGLRTFIRHYFVTGFWFIPLVLQLYLLVPLLRALLQRVGLRTFTGIALIWAGSVALQHTYCGTAACQIWELPLGVQYGGFFMLGYVLTQLCIGYKTLATALVLWAAALLWIISGTYFESLQQGSLSEVYYHYTALPVLLSACAVFILVKYSFSKIKLSDYSQRMLKKLSSASFGIYLSHALFVKLIMATPFSSVFGALHTYSLVTIPLFAIALFGSTYLVIRAMAKSKWLRYFV